MDTVARLERAVSSLRSITQDRHCGPALRGDVLQVVGELEAITRVLTGIQREMRGPAWRPGDDETEASIVKGAAL